MKETHAYIDEQVRERLNELPLATAPAGGWDALERDLDAPKNAHLREALMGLAAAETVTGWQQLEHRLGHRTPEDEQLAEKLNELQPKSAVGSWAALAGRMDRETAAAVDVIVSDGLARTAPVVSSGWAALAARLELIGWRRSSIAAWKVTEGALLLSLFLVFFRFGPGNPSTLGPIADLKDGFPLPMVGANESAQNEIKTTLTETAPVISTRSMTTFVTAEPALGSDRRHTLNIPLVLPTLGMHTYQQNNKAQTQVQTKGLASNDPNAYLLEPIEGLEIKPLRTRMSIPSPALTLREVDNSVPMYTYINGFVSPLDVNQVVTLGHAAGEFKINSERRYTTGFTAGGLLDINKGRNTLQIGVIYSRRAYVPASLKWRYQDYVTPRSPVEGYSKFVYHAIEFPFSYKFTLSENDRWRISARAGMSLSVIAKSEIKDQDAVVAKLEDFENEIVADGFGGNSNFFPNGSPSGLRPPPTDFNSERELKDTPKGWLEGGSILTNSSFYLGGGVTVERIMNPRWSVYMSPSIGRVIYLRDGDGIGPYRDRIHLGSLRMGSRYRFGGKK